MVSPHLLLALGATTSLALERSDSAKEEGSAGLARRAFWRPRHGPAPLHRGLGGCSGPVPAPPTVYSRTQLPHPTNLDPQWRDCNSKLAQILSPSCNSRHESDKKLTDSVGIASGCVRRGGAEMVLRWAASRSIPKAPSLPICPSPPADAACQAIASTAMEPETGSACLMTACSSTEKPSHVNYTIAPRLRGGFYVFATVGSPEGGFGGSGSGRTT